ncbi:unnamed protein product [Vitrella brassicaformis CCMP3155]|uniref:Cyclin N-terminal domain-containing protein n=2 Tax=Vitrella brassicaformis TaxID=1169539 RepID=A0A0G4FF59_VITBC|nr:unnamed protein product [Vitrella brassicaformis CCMP3155]|eukprot:CEM11498.1 unnamed protein product [Vitrella brassicaformis CCMP3155]
MYAKMANSESQGAVKDLVKEDCEREREPEGSVCEDEHGGAVSEVAGGSKGEGGGEGGCVTEECAYGSTEEEVVSCILDKLLPLPQPWPKHPSIHAFPTYLYVHEASCYDSTEHSFAHSKGDRRNLTQWIGDVVKSLRLTCSTFLSAVNVLDRFLDKKELANWERRYVDEEGTEIIPRIDPKDSPAIAVACLYVSAKFHEFMDERCLPVVKDFVKAAPYIKSVDDVRLLEVEVLKTLDGLFVTNTSIDFILLYLARLRDTYEDVFGSVKSEIPYFIREFAVLAQAAAVEGWGGDIPGSCLAAAAIRYFLKPYFAKHVDDLNAMCDDIFAMEMRRYSSAIWLLDQLRPMLFARLDMDMATVRSQLMKQMKEEGPRSLRKYVDVSITQLHLPDIFPLAPNAPTPNVAISPIHSGVTTQSTAADDMSTVTSGTP